MAEHRFKSPDGNEWVTIEAPPAEILAGYPEGTIEVPMVPIPAQEEFVPPSVSARQFRLQLRKPVLPNYPDGIRDAVLAFVAQQSGEVQDAFEYSGSFIRDDPMMQSGFAAMGFTEEQQDQFWIEASRL